jgi:hypothetical protein
MIIVICHSMLLKYVLGLYKNEKCRLFDAPLYSSIPSIIKCYSAFIFKIFI